MLHQINVNVNNNQKEVLMSSPIQKEEPNLGPPKPIKQGGRLKIILAYPNSKWIDFIERTAWEIHPYNLALLAALVEKNHDVEILDANAEDLTVEGFGEEIKRRDPDVLGISVLTNEYGKTGHIAIKLAKEANPRTRILLGGCHAITTNTEKTIKELPLDFVVLGEGEIVFRELCKYYIGEGELPKKGVAYQDGDQLVNLGKPDFILNLDELPYPAYHKFDFLKYASKVQRESVEGARAFPYVRMATSRGCPYNCCFCEVKNISGKRPRNRSVQHIIDEIKMLKKNYGIKAIIFDDDNMLMDLKRAKNLFQAMYDEKLDIKWNSPAMPQFNIDQECIKLMRKSGCQYLNIAIESGSQRMLDEVIHKPLDLNRVREVCKMIMAEGIDLASNFIIGFPGETWEEIRQTVRFAEEIDIDYVKFFIATPTPNTEMYEIAKEQGMIREGFSFDNHNWTDGWIDTPEFRHQDLKILRAYEWDRVNFSLPRKRKKICEMMNISEERLNEIRRNTLMRANP